MDRRIDFSFGKAYSAPDRAVLRILTRTGNITGLFTRQSELVGKRLELLKQALPGISRVAVFWDSFGRRQLEELEPAARSLGIQRQPVQLQAPYDFEVAFKTAKQRRADAVTL